MLVRQQLSMLFYSFQFSFFEFLFSASSPNSMLYTLRSCGRPVGITTFESCIPAAGVLAWYKYSLGFELDPHYCQLPVAEEVQAD